MSALRMIRISDLLLLYTVQTPVAENEGSVLPPAYSALFLKEL